MYIKSMIFILDEFGLGGCDSIITKQSDNIQWDQLGVCPAAMQIDTLRVVRIHMDALKSCLTWRPSPVQEMKSMQAGKNVRELGGM